MAVAGAHPILGNGIGRPTSPACDTRRRGDEEIRQALDSGLLLHREAASEGADSESSLARKIPPHNGLAAGYYTPTQAYKDLLSWPTFIFDAIVSGGELPEPYRSAVRPAHRVAASMFTSVMTPGSRMQVAAIHEITDRVEGPVVNKTEVSGSISHVLVSPGRYPRPTFQPTLEAQVVTEAQVGPETDED